MNIHACAVKLLIWPRKVNVIALIGPQVLARKKDGLLLQAWILTAEESKEVFITGDFSLQRTDWTLETFPFGGPEQGFLK